MSLEMRVPRVALVRWGLLAATVGVAGASCSEEVAEPRPQLIVVVDTDAPLPIQAQADPTISDDAAVDTVRVDVFDAAEQNVSNYRDFVASDPLEWPLSFGIPAPSSDSRYGSPVLLRLRLFRAKRTTAESLDGQAVVEPLRPATIDRLVRIDFPSSGVKSVGVTLSFDCMGQPASFADGNFTTCIDAAQLRDASPSDGIVEDAATSSKVGETALAREVPCVGAPAGKACIPGGFAFLGDADLRGLGETSKDAAPILPMRVSPFALDITEMTVGEFRLVADQITGELPVATAEPELRQCNWSSVPADREDRAVNCLRATTAAEACELAGQRLGVRGHLATEAQWEFAARGRGKGWRFPWGNEYPGCCVAAIDSETCGYTGPTIQRPVRSHPPSDACAGRGDVSPEGVFDLAGNLSEHVLDDFGEYGTGCWLLTGIATDPVCIDTDNTAKVQRGGNFAGPYTQLVSAMRRTSGSTDFQIGVRCAYELEP